MIRWPLQALGTDLLTTAIGDWLAGKTAPVQARIAIAVDGMTLRGSRTTETTARQLVTV